MMYVAKCPLRISLVGGSTDQEEFIQKYGKGSVISFPSNLFAYISVHDNNRGKYIINYSKKEEVDNIDDIQNDVARVCLQHFRMPPITVTFNTDILATGSGLASSTAYTIALVKALGMYKGSDFTEYDTCDLALRLERKFNPLTGYQDPYGCGVGGFKRMDFFLTGKPSFTFLGSSFLQSRFNMALYHTGVSRSSTKILNSIDLDKSLPLLYKVDWMQEAIRNEDQERFLEIFNEGWETKKKTSKLILEDENLQKLDKEFEENEKILAVKLCFLPKTEIEMESGYKFIEDISVGDIVIDHQTNPQKVISPLKRQYSGNIIQLNVTGLKDDIFVTPEHPLMSSFKNKHGKRKLNSKGQNRLFSTELYFKEAQEFKKGEHFLIPIDSTEVDAANFPIPKTLNESKYSKYDIYKGIPDSVPVEFDLLNLLGWYIAEGSANRTQFQYAMHANEMNEAEIIAKSFKRLFNKDIKITINKNSLRIVGSSIVLAAMLNKTCGKYAINKKIPTFIMKLPFKKQVVFLSALWKGDGCIRKYYDKRTNKKYYRCSYKTVSYTLAKQIQKLCFRLGFIASIKQEKKRKNRKISYVVDITGADAQAFKTLVNKQKLVKVVRPNKKQLSLSKDIIEIDNVRYVKRSIRNIMSFNYNGPVYNLSVTNSHTYIANDIAVHNCGAGGGGYFFALCDGRSKPPTIAGIKPIHVYINNAGVVGVKI